MKLQAVFLLSSFAPVGAMSATVLPDACGNEKVGFDIQLQKNTPAPPTPEAGKAHVIFIERSEKPPAMGCLSAGVSRNE
jgi:hypothetical protein